MNVTNDRFIDGRLINLQKEDLQNLERYLKNVSKNEEQTRDELDGLLTQLMS